MERKSIGDPKGINRENLISSESMRAARGLFKFLLVERLAVASVHRHTINELARNNNRTNCDIISFVSLLSRSTHLSPSIVVVVGAQHTPPHIQRHTHVPKYWCCDVSTTRPSLVSWYTRPGTLYTGRQTLMSRYRLSHIQNQNSFSQFFRCCAALLCSAQLAARAQFYTTNNFIN